MHNHVLFCHPLPLFHGWLSFCEMVCWEHTPFSSSRLSDVKLYQAIYATRDEDKKVKTFLLNLYPLRFNKVLWDKTSALRCAQVAKWNNVKWPSVTIHDTRSGDWSCDRSGDLSLNLLFVCLFVYICLVTCPFLETVYSSHAEGTYSMSSCVAESCCKLCSEVMWPTVPHCIEILNTLTYHVPPRVPLFSIHVWRIDFDWSSWHDNWDYSCFMSQMLMNTNFLSWRI